MPPKKQNSKAVAANAKKAAHQAEVDAKARAEAESREASEWSKGAKGKSKRDSDAEKKADAAARKAELAAQLAEEEASIKSKAPKFKEPPPTKAPPILRGADKAAAKKAEKFEIHATEAEKKGSQVELAASNIDDALDLLTAAAIPSGDAAVSTKTIDIEKHPERRVKAAYKAWEERMLPIVKEENPKLRLTQIKEIMFKMWQKAPENVCLLYLVTILLTFY
eukprot:Partr_v1_DN24681_c0_g1_i5_m59492 putative Coiled-coil domain-containing protein